MGSVISKNITLAIMFAFTLTWGGWVNAAVVYDESVSGDFAESSSETVLLNTTGINSVLGTGCWSDSCTRDVDDFLFSIAPGLQLDSITFDVLNYTDSGTTTDQRTFYWLQDGGYSGTELAGQGIDILGSFPVSLFAAALPLTTNNSVYAFNQSGFNLTGDGGTWDYEIQFLMSPVPVPAAVWLFGTAVAGLIGFSRRRKTT